MRLPPRLDRLWTYTVWGAFVVLAPLWIALWWQRHPALGLLQLGIIGYPLWRECRSELRRKRGNDPAERVSDRTPVS